MRTWLKQLICNHDWEEVSAIYYREPYGGGKIESTEVCLKCRKMRKMEGRVSKGECIWTKTK